MDTLLQRPNPLVENLQNLYGNTDERSSSKTNIFWNDETGLRIEGDLNKIIPAFSSSGGIEPFHGEKAITYLLEQYEQELSHLQKQYVEDDETAEDPVRLCQELHRILQPVFSFTTTLRLLAQVSEMSQTFEWQRVYEKLAKQVQNIDKRHASWIVSALSNLDDNEATTDEIRGSAQRLRQTLETKYAPHLNNANDDNNESNQEKFTRLCHGLDQVAAAFQKQEPDEHGAYQEPTKETIRLMYSSIGILTDRSKLLGYQDFFEQTMKSNRRMASAHEIETLHQTTMEQLKPILEATYRRTHKSEDEVALDEYLEAPNPQQQQQQQQFNKPSMHDQILEDEMIQFRFEHYVTLQGAMAFLTRLLDDIFGVTLVRQEESVPGWIKEVQLYHIFDKQDNNRHLGSFYLDPFRRSGKAKDTCVVPMQNRGVNGEVPVATMLLQAELPTWEDDPARLKWDDVKGLFHEMGHILQMVMLQLPYGVTVGPHAVPRDVVEVIPHFMEHWLLERSTIYGLMAASDSKEEFYDESVDAFYRVLARQKVEALAHQVYYATLEHTLLQGFDLRGSESIMALQKRLAKEIVPYNVPIGNDVTPLIRVLQPNACGDPISQYIYLWGDAVAAHIFESLKEAYSQDESQIPKLTKPLRALLLYPGAIVPSEAIRSEWSLGDSVSPETLIRRYGIDALPRD